VVEGSRSGINVLQADALLLKPFDFVTVRAAIEAALAAKSG